MAEETEAATEVEETDDTTTATEKPTTEATPTPPKPGEPKTVAQAEYDRVARDLRIATKEAMDRKKRIAEMEAASATEAEKAILEATAKAAAERDAAWKPAVVEASAEAALASAGCTDPEKQALMMRLIDQDAVELNERRRVIGGLAEQVAVIKEKFPDAFTVPKAPRVPSAREVDAGDKKPPVVKRTATQQQVARIFGA